MKVLTPADLLGPLGRAEHKWAPTKLFALGDPSIVSRGQCVSIVGSRSASEEGLRRARTLSTLLARRGFVVLSGLAKGIDTAAHTSAIDAGGKTVAVIGTPLDVAYPAENRRLQERIAKQHLLLSQFEAGTPTRPGNFPVRNRTMALLTTATVIIEAADGSGTMHQAWEAIRLGRELFIPESMVGRSDLQWPAKLLAAGARLLTGTASTAGQELFDYLAEVSGPSEALFAATG